MGRKEDAENLPQPNQKRNFALNPAHDIMLFKTIFISSK